MAFTLKAKITGDKEVKRKIEKLMKLNKKLAIEAISKSVIFIEGAAKETTAWKNITGRLRSSIAHDVKVIRDKIEGRVGTNVEYGPILEFGRANRPWLLPALKESRPTIIRIIETTLKRARV